MTIKYGPDLVASVNRIKSKLKNEQEKQGIRESWMPMHRGDTPPELFGSEISKLISRPQMDWVHSEDQKFRGGIYWLGGGRWTNRMDRQED